MDWLAPLFSTYSKPCFVHNLPSTEPLWCQLKPAYCDKLSYPDTTYQVAEMSRWNGMLLAFQLALFGDESPLA